MSTITRERLEWLSNISGRDDIYEIDGEEIRELARTMLASLDAEAIYQCEFCHHDANGELQWHWEDVNKDFYDQYDPERRGKRRVIYTTPPAPVVPDELISVMEEVLRISDRDHDAWHRAKAAIAKCRSAILQGAEPVSNRDELPDGWVACSVRMPENDDFVYIWPRPDFGVELHVAQYGKFDKRDAGWYAQVYEQNYGIEYHPITVTHWMPLPAAPQKEVKNG